MSMLIFNGGAVKAMGKGKVGGYAVFFTDELRPDLHNDFFTAETSFELEDRKALPMYFGHGVDPTLGKRKLATASFKEDGQGVWVETQLNLRDEWIKRIYELIKEGKLSFSSGAISHLVERVKKGAASWIKTWPIGEVSFTPAPAAPFGTEVIALKSYREPSLKEIVRRGTLSEAELLREEGMRVREHAEAVLAWVEGGPKPVSVDDWSSNQVMRGAGYQRQQVAQRVAQQDYIAMRAEAKSRLAKIDDLAKEYDELIAAIKTPTELTNQQKLRIMHANWGYAQGQW
jgi:HK97 family phage prohead protease